VTITVSYTASCTAQSPKMSNSVLTYMSLTYARLEADCCLLGEYVPFSKVGAASYYITTPPLTFECLFVFVVTFCFLAERREAVVIILYRFLPITNLLHQILCRFVHVPRDDVLRACTRCFVSDIYPGSAASSHRTLSQSLGSTPEQRSYITPYSTQNVPQSMVPLYKWRQGAYWDTEPCSAPRPA
jgi:hypothetical protein